MTKNFLDIYGIFFIFLYVIIFLTIIITYSNIKYHKEKVIKSLFIWGYLFKILMSICFALIYNFYYNWDGDTYSYYNNSCRLGSLIFSNPKIYFMILFDLIYKSDTSLLPQTIEYFPYFKDQSVYAIHRFLSPFSIIGLKNYYVMSICLNTFLYLLNWKFFKFLNNLFPDKTRIIAISILFIPSAIFWSSGLIKDPFTFSFTFIFIIYFYKIFFKRKISLKNILFILIASYIVLKLKPYILFSVLASAFIWLGFSYIYLIKSLFIKVFVFPFIMICTLFSGIYIVNNVASSIGGIYENVDSMLGKAVASQQDLKQDYYQGMSFDIGNYEPTIKGAISVAPAAIVAGLYRPFIFEAKSLVMLLSGFENLILLSLSIYVLLKGGIKFFLKELIKNPFLIFCLIFSLIMALGIGLSTSNFGALVRFKIPILPFFLLFWLIILSNYYNNKKLIKNAIKDN